MSHPMRVLDLFCGLKGWSAPFAQTHHEVVTIDIDPGFEPTIVADILTVTPERVVEAFGGSRPDVILASPPCETFSVASIGHHWSGGHRAYEPRTEEARVGMALVRHTVALIDALSPTAAVIENPRGVLRRLGIIPIDPVTVWYCHYGEKRAKPTDLWGLPFPSLWSPRHPCHNNRAHGPTCCCRDHEAAPRGARTGTQGIKTYEDRSEIPRQLAEDVFEAVASEWVAAS